MAIVSNQEFDVDIENLTGFGLIHEERVKNTPCFEKWLNQNFLPLFLTFCKCHANSKHQICFRLFKEHSIMYWLSIFVKFPEL